MLDQLLERLGSKVLGIIVYSPKHKGIARGTATWVQGQHILTACHLVGFKAEKGAKIFVFNESCGILEASVQERDPIHDLALLRLLEEPQSLPSTALPIAAMTNQSCDLNTDAFAICWHEAVDGPYGTKGKFAGPRQRPAKGRRKKPAANTPAATKDMWRFVDMHTPNPNGWSGCPIFDQNGNLVSIVSYQNRDKALPDTFGPASIHLQEIMASTA